ncbi:MAG: MATE family efflux transporter [Bacteroidales bacterium]
MEERNKIRKRLISITVPIFIEGLLFMLLGMTDTVMLSRFSDNAVASVGVVNQVFNMVILIFSVTTLGTSVLCSQYTGAGNSNKMTQVVGVSLIFNLALGIATSLFLILGGEMLLEMVKLDAELMSDGIRYLRWVGGFAFLQSISLTISAILRATNRGKYSMMVTLVINVVNVIGNYLLIFGHLGLPAMGVEGAAIATTISRLIAVVILLYILFKYVVPSFSFDQFKPFPFDELKKLLHIGTPAATEQISYSTSQVVVTMFANMMSIEAVTTRTYTTNIAMLTYLFAMAVALGNSILVGQLIGEKRKDDAYRVCLDSLKRAMIVTGIIAGIVAASGTMIMGFLTENPNIIAVGAIVLMIDFILEFGRTINMTMVFALRSTGDARFSVYLGLFSMWVFAVGLSYLLGVHWGYGVIGIWIAFTVDECFRAVILLRRWHSKRWMQRDLIK